MNNNTLLIFHLNGTVVDVSQSIDSVARRVTQFYLGSLLGVSGAGAMVSDEDLHAFRAAGGLDDPIELSAALLRYALSALPSAPPQRFAPEHLGQAAGFLARRQQQLPPTTFDQLSEKLDFAAFAMQITQQGGGRAGVAAALGGWPHPLWVGTAEDELAVVRRLFLELYLGRVAYNQVYRQPPRFYRGPGLYDHERLLIGRHVLDGLRRDYRGRMAAYSEWPRPLVQNMLARMKISNIFDLILTSEDLTAEAARMARRGETGAVAKPAPFLLREAADSLDPNRAHRALVIGNTLDDLRAVQRANDDGRRQFEGWALVTRKSDEGQWRAALRAAGASQLVEDGDDLLKRLNDCRM
ncbi:MAG: hypothetical protein H6637_00320 [Ardenticatenales bacterium]|nr:hypothetical protein [Ardenticatenales bacterium]